MSPVVKNRTTACKPRGLIVEAHNIPSPVVLERVPTTLEAAQAAAIEHAYALGVPENTWWLVRAICRAADGGGFGQLSQSLAVASFTRHNRAGLPNDHIRDPAWVGFGGDCWSDPSVEGRAMNTS